MARAPISVFVLQALRRNRRQLIAGIARVRAGEPFRVGSKVARLPINKFFSKYHCKNRNYQFGNTTLTFEEEEKVVEKLLQQEHSDGYVTFDAIKATTSEVVSTLPVSRRASIRYNDHPPSNSFCENFQKRHCYAIVCSKTGSRDGLEAPLISARDVVTYFSDLNDMIAKDKMRPQNIWCLTARTVQVDIGEQDTFIRYLTMFTVSNASGKLLSYTHIAHNDDVDDAVTGSDDFENWLTHITDIIEKVDTQYQKSEYRYQLLLCDESYMFVNNCIRDWLFRRQVIVYSIPGLSDGFYKNHDVGCAALWAEKFMEYFELDIQMRSPPKRSWTESTLLMFIHMARYASLTVRNISDSFADAGIFPLDEVRFFKHPRPQNYTSPAKLCDVQTMCDMLDAKTAEKEN